MCGRYAYLLPPEAMAVMPLRLNRSSYTRNEASKICSRSSGVMAGGAEAMLAGTMANLMSASIAGMLL